MKEIGDHIKRHVSEVLVEWEHLVREQPWYSLPAEHRIDSLPDVIVAVVDAALCRSGEEEVHRQKVMAATQHGQHRREHGIPEHMIFTEYHLLRQAIWYYVTRTFGSSTRVSEAMMRIDTALTLVTNASMWGYFREEIEGMGKWEESIERMIASSPFLARDREGQASPSRRGSPGR